MHSISMELVFVFLSGVSIGSLLTSIYCQMTKEKSKQEFLEDVRIKQLVNRDL